MPLNPASGGFNPGAGSFVPGGGSPAAEAKEETWESAATEEAAAPAADAAPAKADEVKAPEEEMEKMDVNDDELKKELAAMKAEGLLDDEEEAEIVTGKKAKKKEAAAVAPPVDSRTLKKHINIVFCGHVDAGKSTISGHIMYLTGQVDERTMEKYEREAKAKHRESWKFAWCMDSTDEERAKGKTQECGRGTFGTDKKNYTILDAPGHKNFVPHMIGGASQADVACLVISVRKGEFEAGFDRGGQSREHVVLAKTAGVKTLIVGINKMDDPSVCLEGGVWDEERYNEVKAILLPFLTQTGFKKDDLFFMPISGFTGANLKNRVDTAICPWYNGPALLEYLDDLQPSARFYDMPLRFPIADKYKDMGTCVMGKLEAGTIKKGESLVIVPNKITVTVDEIFIDQGETVIQLLEAGPGDNIKMKLKGVEEDQLRLGFVLCRKDSMCRPCRWFDATVQILDFPTIICAGYTCVLHIHSSMEECTFFSLKGLIDKKTRKVATKDPKFCKQGDSVIVRIKMSRPICVEKYKDFTQMGRFMLRDQGNTIGVGIINELKFPEDKKKEKSDDK